LLSVSEVETPLVGDEEIERVFRVQLGQGAVGACQETLRRGVWEPFEPLGRLTEVGRVNAPECRKGSDECFDESAKDYVSIMPEAGEAD
jgi:hypothetical protein